MIPSSRQMNLVRDILGLNSHYRTPPESHLVEQARRAAKRALPVDIDALGFSRQLVSTSGSHAAVCWAIFDLIDAGEFSFFIERSRGGYVTCVTRSSTGAKLSETKLYENKHRIILNPAFGSSRFPALRSIPVSTPASLREFQKDSPSKDTRKVGPFPTLEESPKHGHFYWFDAEPIKLVKTQWSLVHCLWRHEPVSLERVKQAVWPKRKTKVPRQTFLSAVNRLNHALQKLHLPFKWYLTANSVERRELRRDSVDVRTTQ